MKKLLLILPLVFLLCITFSCQKAEEVAEEPVVDVEAEREAVAQTCLLYTSPSPRDRSSSRMPSSA